MKKLVVISSFLLLTVTACSSEEGASSKLNGKWVVAAEQPGACRAYFNFSGENSFQIKNSKLQGEETSSGTYELVEGNEYQFDYGSAKDTFYIDLEDEQLKVQMSDSKNICEYNKDV